MEPEVSLSYSRKLAKFGALCDISYQSEEALLAPRPIPNLEDHTLLAVRDCLSNIFAATVHISRGLCRINMRPTIFTPGPKTKFRINLLNGFEDESCGQTDGYDCCNEDSLSVDRNLQDNESTSVIKEELMCIVTGL
jgi:hypothetical protein